MERLPQIKTECLYMGRSSTLIQTTNEVGSLLDEVEDVTLAELTISDASVGLEIK